MNCGVAKSSCAMVFAITSFAFLAPPLAASQASYGYINTTYGTASGAVLFNTTGSRTTAPSCQSSTVPQRFAIDATSTAGQTQAAVLTNAYNQHKRIFINGTGTCTIQPDTETVSFFVIEDVPPPSATDWNVTAHVSIIEPTYAPGNLTFTIDAAAGSSCPAGTFLVWVPQGDTLAERVASYNNMMAALLTAQAAGTTITILGANSGCQVSYLHKN